MGRGDFELLLVTIIWGINSIAVKDALGKFLPLQFNVIRLSLSAVLLLAVLAFTKKMEYPAKKDWPIVILAGFLGNTLYQYTFIKGRAAIILAGVSIVRLARPAGGVGRVPGGKSAAGIEAASTSESACETKPAPGSRRKEVSS